MKGRGKQGKGEQGKGGKGVCQYYLLKGNEVLMKAKGMEGIGERKRWKGKRRGREGRERKKGKKRDERRTDGREEKERGGGWIKVLRRKEKESGDEGERREGNRKGRRKKRKERKRERRRPDSNCLEAVRGWNKSGGREGNGTQGEGDRPVPIWEGWYSDGGEGREAMGREEEDQSVHLG